MPLNKQRAVANVRERKRTQLLNQAYKQLQSIIPKEPSDKMSKIHTLKLALAYIHFLNDILKTNDNNELAQSLSDSNVSQQPSLKSPTAYSPCSSSYAQMSLTSEEEEDYQHCSKKMRLDDPGHHSRISSNLHHGVMISSQTTSNCYVTTDTSNPHSIPAQINYSPHTCYPTSSSVASSSYYSEQAPTPDEMTISLRDAFREYRAVKRKSRT